MARVLVHIYDHRTYLHIIISPLDTAKKAGQLDEYQCSLLLSRLFLDSAAPRRHCPTLYNYKEGYVQCLRIAYKDKDRAAQGNE